MSNNFSPAEVFCHMPHKLWCARSRLASLQLSSAEENQTMQPILREYMRCQPGKAILYSLAWESYQSAGVT